MIHLAHTVAELAGVRGPIWFPSATLGTPFGTSIALADKYILAVKSLQAWTVGVLVWRDPRPNLDIVITSHWSTHASPGARFLLQLFAFQSLLLLSFSRICPRYYAGIVLRRIEDPHVRREREREENGVQNHKSDREAVLAVLAHEVIDYIYRQGSSKLSSLTCCGTHYTSGL